MILLPNIPGRLHFAAEFPTCLWQVMKDLTDYDFLIGLTATKDLKYRELYTREIDRNRFRIVDNGVFEDPLHPLTPQALLRISDILLADEVVPTDKLNDADATLRLMDEFLALSREFSCQIQGVVQGSSLKEWLRCFWHMHDNVRVDVIGITYCEVPPDVLNIGMADFGVPDVGEQARLFLLQLIFGGVKIDSKGDFYIGSSCTKPIHLLGLRHCKAINYYRQYPLIRSIDTSFPVQLGIEGKPLKLNSVKPITKVVFNSVPIRAEVALIAQNTLRFLEICRGQNSDVVYEIADRLAQGFNYFD